MKKISLAMFCLLLVSFSACSKSTNEVETSNEAETNIETEKSQVTESTEEEILLENDLMLKAQEDDPGAYQLVLDAGGEIKPTSNGRSFTVWWEPEDFDAETGVTFVALHGHASWATSAFRAWQKEVDERDYAFLAVSWWMGESQEVNGYLKHDEIYPLIKEALDEHGVSPGQVIFEGFSMGSASSYIVTAMDQQEEQPYFAATIANSGVMEPYEPYNSAITAGDYGEQVFEGTNWILYCGEQDEEHPGWCPKMDATETWIEDLGGNVALYIRDPIGKHSGMNAPQNLDRVVDLAESFIENQ